MSATWETARGLALLEKSDGSKYRRATNINGGSTELRDLRGFGACRMRRDAKPFLARREGKKRFQRQAAQRSHCPTRQSRWSANRQQAEDLHLAHRQLGAGVRDQGCDG